MLRWDDTSKAHRVLIGALVISGIYLFGFAAPHSTFGFVFLALFFAVFIYHSIASRAASRRHRKKKEDAEHRESELRGAPPKATPEILAGHDTFELLDVESGKRLGAISRALLDELIKAHESWGLEANDFFILAETPQYLEETGGSKELVLFLDKLLAGRDSMTVRWVIDQGAF